MTCVHIVNLLYLSSNVVSVAAEWDWSKGLSGMGSKYIVLKVKVLSIIYSKYYLQGIATSAKLNDIINGVVQDIGTRKWKIRK